MSPPRHFAQHFVGQMLGRTATHPAIMVDYWQMSEPHAPEQRKHLRQWCLWVHCVRAAVHVVSHVLVKTEKN